MNVITVIISFTIMFTTERQQEVRQILSAYFEGKELPEGTYTRGHWKRGIK